MTNSAQDMQDILNAYADQTDAIRDDFLQDARTRGREMDKEYGDNDMKEMYESDASDAEHVASLLREGKFLEACEVVRRLDTSPRERYDWFYSDSHWH